MVMRIGIVDTTFSRVDMGAIALDELKKGFSGVAVERRTVPGIKDLAVECKRLLDSGCDICMALGMVGGAPIDTQCGHEASLGIQQAKLLTGKHIIEVFVHEDEAWSERELVSIFENRIRKHAHNAVLLVKDPLQLTLNAGNGVRQGREDEGRLGKERRPVIGIVAGVFNKGMAARMKAKALETAEKHGALCRVLDVPGVYDMPLVVKKMLMDKNIDAVVALGAVIKGETAHDEVITKDVAKRLGGLSLQFNKPVTLGIIGHGAERQKAEERVDEYSVRATEAAFSLLKTLRE
ncbi:MAG: riboflavin synthase [Candidatus Micrarchaeota archaeon]